MAVDWNKPLNEWTEAEIDEARGSMGAPDEVKEKKKVSATLPDGTVVEADDYEALSNLMSNKMTEYYGDREEREERRQAPTPPAPVVLEKFNMDEFAKKFMVDPAGALEYMDTATMGFSSRKALAGTLVALDGLTNRVKEMEVERFLENEPSYKPTQKNMKVLTEVLQENNWPVSYRNLKKAFAIARNDGGITVQETKAEREAPPPRLKGRASDSGGENTLPNDIMDTARNMPIEKLEEFLFNKGAVKTRRFS